MHSLTRCNRDPGLFVNVTAELSRLLADTGSHLSDTQACIRHASMSTHWNLMQTLATCAGLQGHPEFTDKYMEVCSILYCLYRPTPCVWHSWHFLLGWGDFVDIAIHPFFAIESSHPLVGGPEGAHYFGQPAQGCGGGGAEGPEGESCHGCGLEGHAEAAEDLPEGRPPRGGGL